MLRVSSRSGNFRRAGYSFGTEPQDLPLAALSEAQRAAIIAEPMLVAVEVEALSEVGDAPEGQAAVPTAVEVPTAKPAAKALVKKQAAKANV